MPLRPMEMAQCQYCEARWGLGELDGVRIKVKKHEVVVNKRKWKERGGLVGYCPDCGMEVCQHDIL